ncbi:hypothetical protein [Clostridium tertium]|uniref:hypothetical protein n=1 Tax=Clostridium tertium TaxID=1559 RepID=UPI001AE3CC2A|nr:hypothetical protein [Clostridium tertium]MBP1870296.1 vacuolar-type H+-ATPase subunit I/STV1 [Clostridium tertium]
MNKKDLLEFIDRVERKAISSVEDRFNKAIEVKKNEVLAKYEDSIDLLQDTFNRFSVNLTNLLTDMSEDLEVAYSGNYYIKDGLKYLSNIKNRISSSCDFKGEVQKLEDQKKKEIEEVRANYKKVYVVSKSMSSAKKIAEYLEGLGFDLSSLKEDEINALVADIDKSKLFVCGERK